MEDLCLAEIECPPETPTCFEISCTFGLFSRVTDFFNGQARAKSTFPKVGCVWCEFHVRTSCMCTSVMQRALVSKVLVSICTTHQCSRCHPCPAHMWDVPLCQGRWSQQKHSVSKQNRFLEPCSVPVCHLPSTNTILGEACLCQMSLSHHIM